MSLELKELLPIQEFDMQMIQLMRLKEERLRELDSVIATKQSVNQKVVFKESEIIEIKMNVRMTETEVKAAAEKVEALEAQQNLVKKVDEFNALSHEISRAEKDRVTKDQRLEDLQEKLVNEETLLVGLKEQLEEVSKSSQALEAEIKESIVKINEEGLGIKSKRDAMVGKASEEIFQIYERLLKNKKDRVIVPIENRCCSGCHIVVTAQHENLVRKGQKMVFCEHCSRIHYWQDAEIIPSAEVPTKQRRRRKTT